VLSKIFASTLRVMSVLVLHHYSLEVDE
jgi:hypothetical protein